MAVVSREAFARRLASFDRAELAAFVADLWAARGYGTSTDGARVVLDDGTVIRCEHRPRPTDADVVVSIRRRLPDGPRTPPSRPRRLGPDDLRGMLLYGIDRPSAEALFERHFDRPLAAEATRPGPAERLRGLAPRPVLGLALLVTIALPLAVAAGTGFGGGSGGGDAPSVQPMVVPTATASPTAVDGFEPPAAGGSLFRYPPGVGPDGVTDAAALAAAHRDAVARTPWDLLLIYRGSADLLHPDRRWVGSRQTVDRSSDSRYWFRVTGLERTGPDAFEPIIYDDFADDRFNYRRTAGNPEPAYRRTLLPSDDEAGVFAAVSAAYIRRYLATSQTRVEVVPFGVTNRYRIVATGTPAQFGPVADYAAVAVVDRRGLVYRLEVQYTRAGPDGTPTATPPPIQYPGLDADDSGDTVSFRMVFRDVGDATVGHPSWYHDARNATNASAVGPWPNDPAL